jgi:hypothetical protein
MQVYAATKAASGPGDKAPRAAMPAGQSLLLTESARSLGGAPSLFEALSVRERETVLARGRRKVLYRGQTLFNQGAKHDGIYLIETGRIRVFYTAPSGREITLAYWNPGNFVGGPEVFGSGVHNGRESRPAIRVWCSFPARNCGRWWSKCLVSRSG